MDDIASYADDDVEFTNRVWADVSMRAAVEPLLNDRPGAYTYGEIESMYLGEQLRRFGLLVTMGAV